MKSLKCAIFTDELHIINVESTFLRGLPSFNIIGLASTTIKESENRIKSSLLSLNFSFPPQKIVINLSPSDMPKNGSFFDLPIALLIALQKDNFDSNFFAFGELGLNGKVKSTSSLFSTLLFLSEKVKIAKVLVPKDIALKAATIPNLDVHAVDSLQDAIMFFKDEEFAKNSYVDETHPLFRDSITINGKNYIPNFNYELDFKDVKGQTRAKRASLIAACGMHNILFEGSPGCGKSMCAKRIRYILPPQSTKDILLTTAYESLNYKDIDFSPLRPFRSPHHTATRSSIFGGSKIGEVALANGGELFFDEFPHFGKKILESLREPLEDNKILISRVNSKIEYKTKFIFVAAQNPCPCGNLFNKSGNCICSEIEIKRYKNAISSALLDRIDLYVAMEEINKDDRSDISSKEMYKEVLKVFKIQKNRNQNDLNGKLKDSEINKFCILENSAKDTLDLAISKFELSQRGINKTLKVARTVADLENKEAINKFHILESLSFRMRSVI
ncbi:magnesium chelatase-related protein [Campylobacter blaseri]|uniref:Fis family transcriptional regulator n=1 Tax=Campylobacter blaseri TaxID=2042961 RepID=A0A2P8R0Y4_9BACT|nr:YifB family Mg chelatase-like AAA ATPase [Campylobacter blaseri]PSM52150.1 Fis family transcriptional regulator [Campylobacter blaseri]PSM53916.1 Fis family transcriptional regulator [Campylobacter blaseri]QKF85350.1 magnesium chelatase-related protein [Campylobacter blaseri]